METFFAAEVMGVPFLRPADGTLHGFLRGLMSGGIGEAFVEDHHDVASERKLDIDGAFGREHVGVAVEMRTEEDAFFRHLPESVETENLEASRVGEYGARPGHEFVQAAHPFNALVARAEEEMVSVGENDFGVEINNEIARGKSFDGALRADGHEHGRFDGAVSGVKETGASPGVGAGGLDFEAERIHEKS